MHVYVSHSTFYVSLYMPISEVWLLNVDRTIELVLIDQQSVGKRHPHLMDTANAKKRWTTIYWRVINF
jgi:hypothetical protein